MALRSRAHTPTHALRLGHGTILVTAAGHDNASGGSLGTLDASGVLEARYTVLSPADSLVDLAAPRVAGIGPAAPGSARDRRCFL